MVQGYDDVVNNGWSFGIGVLVGVAVGSSITLVILSLVG